MQRSRPRRLSLDRDSAKENWGPKGGETHFYFSHQWGSTCLRNEPALPSGSRWGDTGDPPHPGAQTEPLRGLGRFYRNQNNSGSQPRMARRQSTNMTSVMIWDDSAVSRLHNWAFGWQVARGPERFDLPLPLAVLCLG